MAKKRETQPIIQIDDFHPQQTGVVESYKASWQEAGVIATLWLDVVDRNNWQHGHFRPNAYELTSNLRTVSGRPMGAVQEETAFMPLRELRAQVLTAMSDAGWQEVDSTREGRPIYQYRPAPHLTLVPPQDPSGELDPAAMQITQAQQAESARGDAPAFLIDDLSIAPYTWEMKERHEEPRSYRAIARQGEVQASLSIRHASNPLYPGGYVLADQLTDRVDHFAPGAMGKQQEARARALQPLLRERVEVALLAAGWEQRWRASHGVDHWLYVGSTDTTAAEPAAASDQENQVEPEPEAPDIILAGVGAEVSGDDQAEELEIDQGDQPEQEPRLSHVIYVIGSEEAKERGQQPAYSREVFAREVTFTCVVCKQTVTQQRFPGNPPLYCSDTCKAERQRERTRERVAKHRKEKKKAIGNNPSQEVVTP